jgi:spore maturation protein CgeB
MTYCTPRRLALVGKSGGTNIADSFRRAAVEMGHRVTFFDAGEAYAGPRVIRALVWRLGGHRPIHLKTFSKTVVQACATAKPEIVISTGMAPLTNSALRAFRDKGALCVNYSTDDPWSPNQYARWYLKALPVYDIIFTTRRANIVDFQRLGCRDVRHLPFGYDRDLFAPAASTTASTTASLSEHDVLFVGGADQERVEFIRRFVEEGARIALAGDYWERHSSTSRYSLGHVKPDEIRRLTAAAKVNLCLVRRANRDGHVMRSFEIAAVGACMLVEDTVEHRELFGDDGECVVYFHTPEQAATRAKELILDKAERERLAAAVRDKIVDGHHTYRDRLKTILFAVSN